MARRFDLIARYRDESRRLRDGGLPQHPIRNNQAASRAIIGQGGDQAIQRSGVPAFCSEFVPQGAQRHRQ